MPLVEDRQAVAERLRLRHIVGGEEDRGARTAQLGEHMVHRRPRRWIKPARRFIEE